MWDQEAQMFKEEIEHKEEALRELQQDLNENAEKKENMEKELGNLQHTAQKLN